MRSTDH